MTAGTKNWNRIIKQACGTSCLTNGALAESVCVFLKCKVWCACTFLSEMRADDRQHTRVYQVANFSLRGEFPVCAVEAVIFFFLSQGKGCVLARKVRMSALKVSRWGKLSGKCGNFLEVLPQLRLRLELLASLALRGSMQGATSRTIRWARFGQWCPKCSGITWTNHRFTCWFDTDSGSKALKTSSSKLSQELHEFL